MSPRTKRHSIAQLSRSKSDRWRADALRPRGSLLGARGWVVNGLSGHAARVSVQLVGRWGDKCRRVSSTCDEGVLRGWVLAGAAETGTTIANKSNHHA